MEGRKIWEGVGWFGGVEKEIFLNRKKKQKETWWKSLRIFGGSGEHFRYGFFRYFLLILPHYHWSLSSHPPTWASLVYFVVHWVVLDLDLLSCLPLFWFFSTFLCFKYPSPYPLHHLLNKSNIHHHPPTNIGSHGDFRKTESRTTTLLPFSRVSYDWIVFKPWRDWCREEENGPIAWRLWLLHCCHNILYQSQQKLTDDYFYESADKISFSLRRKHFGVLLENMKGSDVVFDVAGEKFSCV